MANFFHMISSFNVNVSVMLITCWALTWTTSSSSSIQTKASAPARQKLRKKFMSAFIQKPECLIISQFWNKTLSDSKDMSNFYLPKKLQWDDTTPQNVSERHSNPGLAKIPPSLVKDRPLPDSFILQFPVSRSPKSPRIISKVFLETSQNYLSLHLGRAAGFCFFVGLGFDFTSPDFEFTSPDFDFTSPGFDLTSPEFDFASPDFALRELSNLQRFPFPSSSQASQQLIHHYHLRWSSS